MRYLLSTVVCCLISLSCVAQAADTIEFKVLDPPAQFEGGYSAFYKFLGNTLIYPPGSKAEGKVFVEFVIGSDGHIEESSVRTLTRKELLDMEVTVDELIEDEAFSRAAIRAIKLCPPWTPGKFEGVPSRQRMIVPIVFRQ